MDVKKLKEIAREMTEEEKKDLDSYSLDTILKKIALRIRMIMNEKGISLASIVKSTGMPLGKLNSIYNGQLRNLTLKDIAILEVVLGDKIIDICQHSSIDG